MTDQNIDNREILKFERMASHWWDPDGALKGLHDINGARVGYVDRGAGLKGKQALDVGCGGGILAEALAVRGAVVTGIDAGSAPLAVARSHGAANGFDIDYRRSTAEHFAAAHAGRFDVVTCMELLEHVPEPHSIVTACARLARPGGHVFFATLNRNPWSFLLVVVAAEYLLGIVPRGTHRPGRFIKPRELGCWAAAAGLTAVDLSGLQYNPFFRTCRVGGSRRVNYLAHYFRPPIG